jgi:hypothetical protein
VGIERAVFEYEHRRGWTFSKSVRDDATAGSATDDCEVLGRIQSIC